MWNANQIFDVTSKSKQMITGWTHVNGQKTLVTFVYVRCSLYKRRSLWLELERLYGLINPWIVVGDINSVRGDDGRLGGHPRLLAV